MAALSNEWDDIPNSSELFGGDFFGDELMEMYTADHGLNLGGSATSAIISTSSMAVDDDDESYHPGILIAMNAAAMDGGLSPLGSSPEFVPHVATSDGSQSDAIELPPYPTLNATTTAGAPAPAPVAATALKTPPVAPTQVASSTTTATRDSSPPVTRSSQAAAAAKRPVASVSTTTTQPAKKRKGVAHSVTAVAKAAKNAVASLQTKKVATLPSKTSLPQTAAAAPAPSTTAVAKVPPVNNKATTTPVVTQAVRPPSASLLKNTTTTAGVKSSGGVIPKPKATTVGTGGINQNVVRPSAVPSSSVASAQRVAPPTSATSRPTGYKPSLPMGGTSTSLTGGVRRASTEADFKDVASAAVSSLIQNASTTLKTAPKSLVIKSADKKVDTSTAHINALTSQNWVTACNPIPTPDLSSSSSSSAMACDKAARNARRATLTQEERAKQNRDRNREHARNTRLRKKAYVEELKRTLTELVAQRDAADLEKRHEAQRNREQREVRFRVMEEFLKLRGRNELNSARWVAILEDGFTLTIPRTTFRSMVSDKKSSDSAADDGSSSSSQLEQVLRGASSVMEDSAYLSKYLQTVGGPPSTGVGSTQVQIVYQCDRKRFFMDGNIAVMDITATTAGCVAKGAPNEVVFKGLMKSSFSPASNKLITVDITFDTGTLVQQVQALADAQKSTTDAAMAAANDADALLDSLQMPPIFNNKEKSEATTNDGGPVSVSSDDGEQSTSTDA